MSFIFADLRRLWLGAAVMVLLVALATALGVAVTLQERALRLGSARAADRFDLVIGAAGSETQLVLSSVFLQPSPLPLMSGEILAKLNADPRVSWAAPVGFGDSFLGHPIVGTTTKLIAGTTPGLSAGAIFAHEGEAVVGAGVDLAIGSEVKPMHGTVETGGETHKEIAYRVVGKLKPTGTPWDRAILVPVQAVWHLHGLGAHDDHDDDDHDHDHDRTAAAAPGHDAEAEHHDEHDHHHGHVDADAPVNEAFTQETPGLPAILVKPRTIADAYRLRQEYRSGATLAVFPGEVLTKLYATLGDAKFVLAAVSAGSQVLVAAALLLVSLIHVGQRRRQIGALRAFGAPRMAVFSIVWSELFGLVAIGIGLGFTLGYTGARLIGQAFTAQTGVILPVGFAVEDWRIAALLLLLAALFAAIPALLAYRQSPAQALRS